ncbi:MAG: TIGR00269 family protein [Candidatus Altiarchaeota archaeon]|nr:TIGR00269 family protein [Candidatus Altiarchaeota archaeon]
MFCSRCNSEAVIELKYSGESLCKSCFLKLFEGRVKKTLRSGKLLGNTDKTAVALSGGKDSMVTLYMLDKLSRKAPKSELIAVSIDQGVKGFQKKGLDIAESVCSKLGVKHYVYSFREEFGVTLDEIIKRSRKLENPAPACSYCGVLRRWLLNTKAGELGVTRIATGHNLDDEVQTGLMNFIRGDLDRMARMGALVGVIKDKGFVPRIKPLRGCPENEVELYARLRKLDFQSMKCPHSTEAFRGTIRGMVDKLEINHPGSKFQILGSIDELIQILRSRAKAGRINRCEICGSLTSGDLCKVCQIKRELDLG